MKKRISIVVALVLLITNLLSVVSFADFSDVSEESQYREAIITLTKFGIINGYDDGSFKPEGEITRAEFTKMIMTALGRGNAGGEPTEFSDVSTHWAKSYIKSAYDMGIINGFPDGTFAPDAQVTYEQALKMVVCALGYVDFAEAKGGYPAGYTSQARTLNLTEGVTGQKDTEPALRQVIAQVVYNALEVEKLEKNRKDEWEPTGKTILSDDLDMAKMTGTLVGVEDVVTEACQTTLLKYQMAVNSKGEEVIIDAREYEEMTVAGLQNYVGNEVTVYYRTDSDEKFLVIFDADTVKNSTQTISYDDVSSYNGATLKYFEGDNGKEKSKTVKVDEVTVIYNGQTLTDDGSYTLVSKTDSSEWEVVGKAAVLEQILNDGDYKIYGDITLTDSGSDGTVDMVTINDYRWMIAHRAVSNTNYTVQNTLVTTDTLLIDPEDPDSKIYVEKNGKEVAPTAISKGDVVTYTKSFDGKIVKVYASKQTIEGKVSSMRADEITIGTEVYTLDPRCIEFIQSKSNKTLTIGNTITAYLDKMGTVVYAEISEETAAPYAYIANMTLETAEDALYITAFIPSISKSSAATYKVAQEVRINNRIYESSDEAHSVLLETVGYNNPDAPGVTPDYTGTEGENTEHSQVARIKVVNGEITEIVTIDGEATGANSDASTIVRGIDLDEYSYSSGSFKLDGSTKFSVNSSTIIINVPADRTDKNNYALKAYNSLSKEEDYWIEAYDINENNYAGLIIRYSTGDNTLNKHWYDSSFSIVGGANSQQYDEDEDTTVVSVPLYIDSTTTQKKAAIASQTSSFSNLEPGDIIQYNTDNEGRMRDLAYVIKYADILEVLEGDTYAWDEETDVQNASTRWQKYMFDFKYPESGLSGTINTDDYYKTYTSSSLGEIARSRAAMFNVLRVIPEEGKIHVTRQGFEADGTMGEVDYEDVAISSSTKIIRAITDGSGNITKFTDLEEDGETKLSIESFMDAQSYGTDCSKIMVATNKGSVKMIVIYE